MSKSLDNRNCILYSNLYPINKDPLLELVKKYKLNIVEIIEEDPAKYKRANKQPQLANVFAMLEAGKAKFLVVESLNHLFTVNGYEVLRYFRVLHDLEVAIWTPECLLNYGNCSGAVLDYCEHRTEFLRTLAARAGIARGNRMGRRRVECDVQQLVVRVLHYRTIMEAAREMNLCPVTAMRRLREAGYDLDKLREGETVFISQEEIREKAAVKAAARARARAAKLAKAGKVLEIKEK